MLRFSKFIAVAAVAAASSMTAQAQSVVSATKPFSLGISGGASIPTGDFGGNNGVNTGYNVAGHVGLGVPALPVTFRGDVGYNSFGVKGVGGTNATIWEFTANAVYSFPTVSPIRPYIIGGIGAYRPGVSTSSSGSSYSASDGSKFGFNAGAGLTIPLTGFNAFVEARYHRFNNGDSNGISGGSTSFVPITFGVMF